MLMEFNLIPDKYPISSKKKKEKEERRGTLKGMRNLNILVTPKPETLAPLDNFYSPLPTSPKLKKFFNF